MVGKELIFNSVVYESEYEERKDESAVQERRSSLKIQNQYSVERVSTHSANLSSPANSDESLSQSTD